MKGWPVLKKAGFDLTFPDLVTSLNLVAGVLAVFSAVNNDLLMAKALIVAGMAFDYVDGKFARAYKQDHPFGRELDSLADLITFGLAPAVILLLMFPGNLVLVGAAIFAVAAALRLARFNISQADKKSPKGFSGLPVPAAASVLLALTFAPLTPIVAFVSLIILALLMLSTIKLPKI